MSNKIGAFINAYAALDLESGLKGIRSAGFRYVDLLATPGIAKGLLPDPLMMNEEKIIREKSLLKKYDLKVSGIYYYKGGKKFFDKTKVITRFERLIDISVQFKTAYIITDTDEVKTNLDKKEFYNYINSIADMAAKKGKKICLDIHGNWLSDGKKACSILEKINNKNVFLNYCTGNVFYYGDVDPVLDIEFALPFIERIHLKDSSGIYKDYDFPALGEGKVDFISILEKLGNKNLDLIAELELEGEEKDKVKLHEAFKKSYKYLKVILKKDI